MEELIKKLNEARRAYYQDGREIMSNREYDYLYDKLVQIEKETGIVLSGSPTQKVGYEVLPNLPKKRHESPMLSLDKTKSVEDLKDWLGNHEGVLSWKLDGLTVVLTYNNGKLQKAVTRGNGEVGEVITNNAKCFENVPLKIPYNGNLVVRGEAVISYEDFNKLNTEGKYKNPRNLAAGSIRQLDNRITRERYVRFISFELVNVEEKIDTIQERLNWLEQMGFQTVYRIKVNSENIEDTVKLFESYIQENPIPSDGLVLTFNDYRFGQSLGKTEKFPRHSIAFKWKDDTAETVLRDVEWNPSRTGLINPVAIFNPVELEGTTVSRATLNNVSFIEELQLGIGDTLTVYKANMIIPQIDDNLTRSGGLHIPEKCPVCGSKTHIIQENDSKMLYCTNSLCKAKLIARLDHFASREGMNINGLSESTLEFLIKKGWVRKFFDIYDLQKHGKSWTASPGFAWASVKKILDSIEKSKKVNPQNFLYALGIPGIGKRQSKEIMKKFGSWEAFSEALDRRQNFSIIPGIGDLLDRNIHVWYKENKEDVKELAGLMEFKTQKRTENHGNISGKIFVITGTLKNFSRKELQEKIEKAGGKVVESVSSKTSYLINNDENSTSSKNVKAKELAIPIISEEEILGLL